MLFVSMVHVSKTTLITIMVAFFFKKYLKIYLTNAMHP